MGLVLLDSVLAISLDIPADVLELSLLSVIVATELSTEKGLIGVYNICFNCCMLDISSPGLPISYIGNKSS